MYNNHIGKTTDHSIASKGRTDQTLLIPIPPSRTLRSCREHVGQSVPSLLHSHGDQSPRAYQAVQARGEGAGLMIGCMISMFLRHGGLKKGVYFWFKRDRGCITGIGL